MRQAVTAKLWQPKVKPEARRGWLAIMAQSAMRSAMTTFAGASDSSEATLRACLDDRIRHKLMLMLMMQAQGA